MSEKGLLAVIWDMDGVIVDSGPFHFKSWQHVFHKRGAKFEIGDFTRIFGQRNDTIIGKFLPGISHPDLEIVAAEKESKFRELVSGNVRAFPGAVALIKSLYENGVQQSIASSAPPENINLILEKLKIRDSFQAVVYGREVAEGKPSPLIFLRAAEKLGVSPAHSVVMEDAIAGVQAAKNAGMKCVAVTNTNTAANLSQADIIVESLEKIDIKILQRLFI